MPRKHVEAKRGPAALGPYSPGVWAGKLLYLSGQTPVDPETGKLIEGDVDAQTMRAFDNLELVLGDAGLSMDDVIISYFTNGQTKTFPLKVMESIKSGVSPDVNAMSTIILVGTILLVVLSQSKNLNLSKKKGI